MHREWLWAPSGHFTASWKVQRLTQQSRLVFHISPKAERLICGVGNRSSHGHSATGTFYVSAVGRIEFASIATDGCLLFSSGDFRSLFLLNLVGCSGLLFTWWHGHVSKRQCLVGLPALFAQIPRCAFTFGLFRYSEQTARTLCARLMKNHNKNSRICSDQAIELWEHLPGAYSDGMYHLTDEEITSPDMLIGLWIYRLAGNCWLNIFIKQPARYWSNNRERKKGSDGRAKLCNSFREHRARLLV